MIDCSKTENYFAEKRRMTKNHKLKSGAYICELNCADCLFGITNNGIGISCSDFEKHYPKKAIAIVQKWSDEHPQKTFLTDLLEKYPDVPLAKNGYPSICPRHLGYTKEVYINCGSSTCQQCWNTPIEESEVE